MPIEKVILRAPGQYDPDELSELSGLSCGDPSLAQQHMKDETDINVILDRFAVTGELPSSVRIPTYGDFEFVGDYQTAMNALVAARDSFMSLPADLRTRFDNDPHKFVEFCSDEKNMDEAAKLGLMKQPDNTFMLKKLNTAIDKLSNSLQNSSTDGSSSASSPPAQQGAGGSSTVST